MKKMIAILSLAFAAVGCGPGPGKTPEETAEAFTKVQLDKNSKEFDRAIEAAEWRNDCREKEMEWFADKGQLRKDIDNERAMLEYCADHKSEILDSAAFDIVDLRQPDTNNSNFKEVTVKVWKLDVEPKGYKDFKLEYEGRERKLPLVLVDGKWKIKNKK